jgi:hypothetical protein
MFCALPDPFWVVPSSSDHDFICCAPRLVLGATKGAVSRFHVLRPRTHFRLYRGRRVPFSCFALLDSFSPVPRASGPVFVFCAPRLIFVGSEGVRSRFHVLSSRTHFRRYWGCRVPFSYFALPKLFHAESGASSLIFMFHALGLYFGGTEGVRSRFHGLHSRTHFQRYRGRQVSFSCCAVPDSFSDTVGVGSHFHVSGGTEGTESNFQVSRYQTHFQRYCATLFRALRTAAGRWDAEEGHGDPSQACICLMPADSAV